MSSLRFFTCLILAVVISSCSSFHTGAFQSSAALSNGNFSIEKMVFGHAQTTHVFGIGGNSKDALVLAAKKDLYAKNPLRKGEIFANTTVDFKRSYFLFIMRTEVTISADLVRFDKSPERNELQPLHNTLKKKFENLKLYPSLAGKKLEPTTTNSANGISVGDTICLLKNSNSVANGILHSFMERRAWVLTESRDLEKVNIENIFIRKNLSNYTDFTIGSLVYYLPNPYTNEGHINCQVIGMNTKELLLRQSSGSYLSLPFDRVQNK